MQYLVAGILIVVVGAAALVLRRRQTIDPPTQKIWTVPAQIDRNDFSAPHQAWMVVAFTSATCHTCDDIKRKIAVLASNEVAVLAVDYPAQAAVHKRYNIDAVPAVIIADRDGVVRASFLGPVTATDLWAAVAEARDPGSTPEPGLGQRDH